MLEIPSRLLPVCGGARPSGPAVYLDTKVTLADNDLPKVTLMCEAVASGRDFPFWIVRSRSFRDASAPFEGQSWSTGYLFKRAFRNLLPAEFSEEETRLWHPCRNLVEIRPAASGARARYSLSTVDGTRLHPTGCSSTSFSACMNTTIRAYYGDTLWAFLSGVVAPAVSMNK